MVGQTRAALLELTFAEVGKPEDRPAIGQDLPLLRSGDLPELATEKRYPRPDGTELWASVSITPVLEPDGSVDVLFGQMADITERKAREAPLKAQLDEIAGLGEIRRAFDEDRFGDPGLIADIERELERTGADPSRLVFEITRRR